MTKKPNPMIERTAKGEKIGGGWFVFGRHSSSGRIRVPTQGFPFEHPSYEAALREAERLAELFPLKSYCVMKQISHSNTKLLEPPL